MPPQPGHGPYIQGKGQAQRQVRQALDVAAWAVGGMIRNERTRQGLTQNEVAAKIGVPQPYISAVEAGKKHRMTNAKVDALFRELRIKTKLGQREFLKYWAKAIDTA